MFSVFQEMVSGGPESVFRFQEMASEGPESIFRFQEMVSEASERLGQIYGFILYYPHR